MKQKSDKIKGLIRDKKNRYVYYDRMTQVSYHVVNSKTKTFEFLYSRYLLSLVIFLLLSILNITLSIIVGLATLLLTEGYFRFAFLKNMDILENFNIIDYQVRLKPSQYITKSILFLIIAFLLFWTTLNEQSTADMNIMVYGVILYALYESISQLFYLRK
jgi:hypothetical protein